MKLLGLYADIVSKNRDKWFLQGAVIWSVREFPGFERAPCILTGIALLSEILGKLQRSQQGDDAAVRRRDERVAGRYYPDG